MGITRATRGIDAGGAARRMVVMLRGVAPPGWPPFDASGSRAPCVRRSADAPCPFNGRHGHRLPWRAGSYRKAPTSMVTHRSASAPSLHRCSKTSRTTSLWATRTPRPARAEHRKRAVRLVRGPGQAPQSTVIRARLWAGLPLSTAVDNRPVCGGSLRGRVSGVPAPASCRRLCAAAAPRRCWSRHVIPVPSLSGSVPRDQLTPVSQVESASRLRRVTREDLGKVRWEPH